jgi:hypothetical protein
MRLNPMSTEELVLTPERGRRWPRAIVGLGIVAVVGAGLGAYLGIRAVAGPGSAPAAGQPPARTDAAIAYDAADGTVVLFGGQGKSGSLGDTWTWDGSSWTQQHPATSPPAISGAQMTYDPVSHDVVLVGGERLSEGPLAGTSCSSPGSSGSASASGSGGSGTTWIPPTNAKAAAAVPDGILTTPLIATGCGFPDSQNASTWLWNGSDWTKASGTTPAVSFGGWNLVTDPVSGRALLLAAEPWVAEPDVPIAQPAIACPMQTTVTNGDTQPGCPVFPIARRSYAWTGHGWETMTAGLSATVSGFIGSSVIVDGVTGRLSVFSGGGLIPETPVECPTCTGKVPRPIDNSACCAGTVTYWNGSAWTKAASYKNGPMLSGGTLVGDAATHSDLYLTADGQTWVWTGVWTRKHPATTPTTLQAISSVYDAHASQVLLFGGIGTTSRASGVYDQTWVWDGSDWTLRGGSTSPAVTIPVPSPVSVPPSLPCNASPASVPPGVPEPQIACSGGDSGEPGSAGGTSIGAPAPPVGSGAVGL